MFLVVGPAVDLKLVALQAGTFGRVLRAAVRAGWRSAWPSWWPSIVGDGDAVVDERTQGALLLAVGGIAIRLGVTDAALAYVKPGVQPAAQVAGAFWR